MLFTIFPHRPESTALARRQQNRFTGWHDVPLSETGEKEAAEAGASLKKAGLEFDCVYTSGK